MERALSNSERIRRAEEVAYRRRLKENRKDFEKINDNKSKNNLNSGFINNKRVNTEFERIGYDRETPTGFNERKTKSGINEEAAETFEHKKLSHFAKFSIQVISSICIFGAVYFFGQNYSDKMQNVKKFFDKDTDFSSEATDFYNVTKSIFTGENLSYWKKKFGNFNAFSGFLNNQNESNSESSTDSENSNTKNKENSENSTDGEKTDSVNSNQAGGSESGDSNSENSNQNEETSKTGEAKSKADTENSTQIAGVGGGGEPEKTSESEDDVTYIKNHVSFVKPLENGTITSRYGEREATEIISANHKGVDIGAEYGSEIKAAMSGKVTLVSEYGDYGKHLEITDNEVSTLYAHCSKIVVSEGDYVEKGQKIAEVGSTGRSTGPHLHFEIRRNSVCVNPEDILKL